MGDNEVTMVLVEQINEVVDRVDESATAIRELSHALELAVHSHKTLWREHQELQARVAQLESANRKKGWFQWR